MISIDIETYSSVDIKRGVYAYTQADDFEILLFAYAFDDEPVTCVDMTSGEDIPVNVLNALIDPDIVKTAFNANFERTCLAKHFRTAMPPEQWECSSVLALYAGLPGKLAMVSDVLHIQQGKMTEGKNLIRYFCVPCAPTKTNGGRERNLPHHDPEKWDLFKRYNIRDVEVERAVRKKLIYPLPEKEKLIWQLDQRINDRGIMVDRGLIFKSINGSANYQQELYNRAVSLSGLQNPGSVAQLKKWILDVEGFEVKSLDKKSLPIVKNHITDPLILEVLTLREEMSKTSVAKYKEMIVSMGADQKLRGLFQFYGANRTGRWCLTGDHEVLTKDGWVRLDEWKGGVISCWSPKTEALSFQEAKSVSFDYEGDVYCIEAQRCSQISTPEHLMPYLGKDGLWKADTVENLAKKRFSIPFTGRRYINTPVDSTELRILIMVQADGHYTAEGNLKFHFTKKRKIERCKSLLRKGCIMFSENEDSTVITVKTRNIPIWLRMFHDKTFKSWIFDESADVIFDELENWDGYRHGPNSVQYCTTNKQNADMIQAVAHLSGRSATIIIKHRNNENWKDAYVVNIWLTPGNCNEIRDKPEKNQFKGKVFCAETETGFFTVRRNGKIWITGNSGRQVQVHNLPKNSMPELDQARTLVKAGNFEIVEMLFGSVADTLSQLIRTTFIPSPGNRLIVADFSAIEARVLSWLADEKWRLDVFATHGKIYEASAAAMFRVPLDKIQKGNPEYALRAKGKVAELALGYAGGVNALITMGALDMGLEEKELQSMVDRWRESNSRIVSFWAKMQAAALACVGEHRDVKVGHGLEFIYQKNCMFIQLPSGRRLAYIRPSIEKEGWKTNIMFEGVNQTTKCWERTYTYGGKLTENITQAIARDCLAESMLRIDKAGYQIVMHVHDETVMDMQEGVGSLADVCRIMGEPLAWAPGLLLRADGFESKYYKKE